MVDQFIIMTYITNYSRINDDGYVRRQKGDEGA